MDKPQYLGLRIVSFHIVLLSYCHVVLVYFLGVLIPNCIMTSLHCHLTYFFTVLLPCPLSCLGGGGPYSHCITYGFKQQFLHQLLTNLAEIFTVCQVWYV